MVASPRTASTTFCEALRSTSEGRVQCLEHEPLARQHRPPHCLADAGGGQYPHTCSPQALLQTAFRECDTWYASRDRGSYTPMDGYFARDYHHLPASCGFKLFGEHLLSNAAELEPFFRGRLPPLVSSLQGVVDRVIILQRRNQTAQFQSWTRAMQTGQWGNIKAASATTERVIHSAALGISVREVDAWKLNTSRLQVSASEFGSAYQSWYQAVRYQLRAVPQLEVWSEDLLSDVAGVAQRAIRFLTSNVTTPTYQSECEALLADRSATVGVYPQVIYLRSTPHPVPRSIICTAPTVPRCTLTICPRAAAMRRWVSPRACCQRRAPPRSWSS